MNTQKHRKIVNVIHSHYTLDRDKMEINGNVAF